MDNKQILLTLSFMLMTVLSFSQHVEVVGQLKVSDMPIENTDEILVTRKNDGTLGTRHAASLNPPADTTRTFERDLALVNLVCNCPSIPVFLVESALANGYSAQNLLDAGVSLESLLAGGVDIPFLIANGITISVLLDTGVPLFELIAQGLPMDSIIGKPYQDGLVFYLDPASSTALVMYPEFVTQPIFGCEGVTVSGLQSSIGTGQANTTLLMSCPDPVSLPTCANFSQDNVGPGQFFESSYTDWYVPSSEELLVAITELRPTAASLVSEGIPYYSSTDFMSDNTQCSTVLIATAGSSPAIVGSDRNVPQFRTVVIRNVD